MIQFLAVKMCVTKGVSNVYQFCTSIRMYFNKHKHLIDAVARDYSRLLKFGDSMYRCKLLKTAALGRMCTIIKRQKV